MDLQQVGLNILEYSRRQIFSDVFVLVANIFREIKTICLLWHSQLVYTHKQSREEGHFLFIKFVYSP